MTWRPGNVETLGRYVGAIYFKLPGVPLAGHQWQLSEINPKLGVDLRALRYSSGASDLKIT